MSIVELMRRMREAGAPPEAVEMAVEAILAEQSKDAERRAKRAAQKAKERAKAAGVVPSNGGDSRATVARQGGDMSGDPLASLDGLPLPGPTPSLNPSQPHDPTAGAADDDDLGEDEAETGKARKQAHRLPEGWRPTAEGWRRAVQELGSEAAAIRTLERFRNHWLASGGQSARKRDWDRTWINWVMRTADDGKRSGPRPVNGHASGSGYGSTRDDPFAAALARREDRRNVGMGAGHRGGRETRSYPADVIDADFSDAGERHRAYYAA